jgi:hypothetical protein
VGRLAKRAAALDEMLRQHLHNAIGRGLGQEVFHVWAGQWASTLTQRYAAESLAPSACTTIEEVGSTGVGALTITFLILSVTSIIFISRAGSANATKK